MVGYGDFRKRQEELRSQGRYLGIGLSTWVEICGIGPSAATAPAAGVALVESSAVRVHPTGSVTVSTGTHSHGQSHETTFAQIVADALGVPYETIDIKHGDTGETPFGYGTYGSRSLAVGGISILKSCQKVVEKAKKLAAHIFEASEEDIVFDQGRFYVKGSPDNAKVLGELAFASYGAGLPEGMEQGLEAITYFDPPNFVWPFGCHICTVEIDAAAVRRGRRLRQRHQPDGRRGSAPRRHRPGHRPGAVRGDELRRRERAAADRHLPRLPGADHGRDAPLRAGPHRHPEPDERAGGQGDR
jgi:carbon-monoxide dehydrogenase large subunit